MSNSNYLIEIKKEYTTQLINMLTPHIYDGINSIYQEVKGIAKDGEELKMFQGFLAKIPNWNETILADEASRIKRANEKNADIIDDLIKAVIQSNILLLTSTDLSEKQKVLKEFNIQLNYEKFIHNIYIEVAKIFYNYPFLFFHKVPTLEYKKNQLKAHKLIKEAIEEAIRKMLPLQLILKKYLGTVVDVEDDKYIRSLVQTENNNKQYGLSKESESDGNTLNNNSQKGGIIQSQPPMSLKEIYEQQKEASSQSVKPLTVPISDNNKNKNNEKNIIIPPIQSKKNHSNKNSDSESSQAYFNQKGDIEEEFSNHDSKKKNNKFKPSLEAVDESGTTSNSYSESGKQKVYNFRGF